MSHRARLPFLLGLWGCAVAVGFAGLASYGTRPEPRHETASVWPTPTPPSSSADGFALLLFVHPLCPCTRASVAELERLRARLPPATTCELVVLDRVEFAAAGYEREPWRRRAERLGAACRFDVDGRRTRAFGATVSGQVLLYDAQGRRVFDGGITVARGHEGWSDASRWIVARIAGRERGIRETPVFGCALFAGEEDEEGNADERRDRQG